MKKILISLFAGIGMVVSAATITVDVPQGSFVNAVTTANGNIKVSQFILTSTNASGVSAQAFDSVTNLTTWTNAPYTQITQYATNQVTLWTNYFGATNYWTNIALVSVTNTVATTTNTYPIRFAGSAIANSSFTASGTYYFNNGIWVTNTGAAGIKFTVTYTQ
jgi:hypothetical protein